VAALDPSLFPVLTPAKVEYEAATRQTGFAEYLGAKAQDGFDYSIAGRLTEAYTTPAGAPLPSGVTRENAQGLALNPDQRRITEDEWRKLRLDRPGLDFSGGGTVEYETARTRAFDERRYRESLIARYQGGLLGQAAGFGAALAGSLATPENFIPFLPAATRAAMVGRMGLIGGRAAGGALDAAIGTVVADAVVLPDLASRGEDVGAEDFALDVALGAVLGSAFGAGSGFLARRAEQRFAREQLATAARAVRLDGLERQADALEVAIRAVSEGEPVDVGPVLMGADAALRRRLMAGTAALPDASLPARAPVDEPLGGAEQTPLAPKETTFLGMLRARGGIRPTSEIDVDWKDLGKRFPGLVSQRGRTVDEMVNLAINEGFLPEKMGENYANRSDELLDLIDQQMSGTRPERINADPEARNLQDERAMIDRRLVERAKAELDTDLSGNELAIARQLVEEQDFEDIDALVQAMTYAALRNDGGLFDGGAAADDFDIPFGDLPEPARNGAGDRPAAGAGSDGPQGALPGAAPFGGTPADDIGRFVADYVAREAAPAPHPSIVEAEASVTRAPPKNGIEEAQRLREAMKVDEPDEMADIAVMKRDGLLTAADEASLTRADELVNEAEGWATAYETLSSCVLRFAR
jgi:hypothetical protein